MSLYLSWYISSWFLYLGVSLSLCPLTDVLSLLSLPSVWYSFKCYLYISYDVIHQDVWTHGYEVNFRTLKMIWWSRKKYIVIFGHYIFIILEFIYYIKQVICKLVPKENNITSLFGKIFLLLSWIHILYLHEKYSELLNNDWLIKLIKYKTVFTPFIVLL